VVRSRRDANKRRRISYVWARRFVVISMLTTVAELIYALIART
jgi:hypothetical protein